MKSYTDLEQSIVLSEILPLESADMVYIKHSSSNNPNWEFNEDFPPMILGNVPINEMTVETLPCWSLAVLLGVLKERNNCNALEMFTNKAQLYTITTSYYKDASWKNISIVSDNPVDACYEIIIKLNELKML